MPWTKSNYPDSMKKLPAATRTKAIAIANAILIENKKMAEGKIIATAIKRAKETTVSSSGKTKTTVAASKKAKKTAGTKTKSTLRAKAKRVVKKKKAKPRVAAVAKRKIKIASKNKAKSVHQAKAPTSVKASSIPPAEEIRVAPKITHGEDLHLIPVAGEIHPVRIDDANKVERIFHHDEEVAFHRENQRVKESMSTRKSSKPIFRNRGRRS